MWWEVLFQLSEGHHAEGCQKRPGAGTTWIETPQLVDRGYTTVVGNATWVEFRLDLAVTGENRLD